MRKRYPIVAAAALVAAAFGILSASAQQGKDEDKDYTRVKHNVPLDRFRGTSRDRLVVVDFDADLKVHVPGQYQWRVEVIDQDKNKERVGYHEFPAFQMETLVAKQDRMVWGLDVPPGRYRVFVMLYHLAPTVDMDGNLISQHTRFKRESYTVVVRGQ